MLRAEARKRAGMSLSPRAAKSLSAWLGLLQRDRTVVHYDRKTTGGWRYLPKREGIDLGLIREPSGLSRHHDEGRGQISVEVEIVYEDGRTVPFDPELLSDPN